MALPAFLGAVVLAASSAVPAAAQGTAAPEFLITVPSAHGFDETLDLLRQAIENQNMMIIHEINPQQMLRLVGMKTGGMRQVLFFHPRYMKQIVEANMNGGIEAPLKLLVVETPNGKVLVRYIDPTYQFGRYRGLEAIGQELKGVIENIVASIRN